MVTLDEKTRQEGPQTVQVLHPMLPDTVQGATKEPQGEGQTLLAERHI